MLEISVSARDDLSAPTVSPASAPFPLKVLEGTPPPRAGRSWLAAALPFAGVCTGAAHTRLPRPLPASQPCCSVLAAAVGHTMAREPWQVDPHTFLTNRGPPSAPWKRFKSCVYLLKILVYGFYQVH